MSYDTTLHHTYVPTAVVKSWPYSQYGITKTPFKTLHHKLMSSTDHIDVIFHEMNCTGRNNDEQRWHTYNGYSYITFCNNITISLSVFKPHSITIQGRAHYHACVLLAKQYASLTIIEVNCMDTHRTGSLIQLLSGPVGLGS